MRQSKIFLHFPLRTFCRKLKSIRGTRYLLEEIIKRYYERQAHDAPSKPKNLHKIACGKRDSYFRVADGVVCLQTKLSGQIFRCTFYEYANLRNFYTEPAESRLFGTYYIPPNCHGIVREFAMDKLMQKCVSLPYMDGDVILTLCHTDIY